jgi:hypothetical protein
MSQLALLSLFSGQLTAASRSVKQPHCRKLFWRLAPLFVVGLIAAFHANRAAATIVNADELSVTRNGSALFDDSFSQNVSLAGGAGTFFPSGLNFSTGAAADYFVKGTASETTANNGQMNLNTANGIILNQPDPFFSTIQLVNVALETNNTGTATSLDTGTSFAVNGLLDLSTPSVADGTYDLELTNRLTVNSDLGNVLQLRVRNCVAGSGFCSATGTAIQFVWLDYINDTDALIDEVVLSPAELLNSQIEFSFTKSSSSSDVICGSYALGTGNTLGTFSSSVTGNLGCTDAATDVFNTTETGGNTVQAALNAFDPITPVPEPSSFVLMGSALLGLVGLARARPHKRCQ